jgi:hypothetical protein
VPEHCRLKCFCVLSRSLPQAFGLHYLAHHEVN